MKRTLKFLIIIWLFFCFVSTVIAADTGKDDTGQILINLGNKQKAGAIPGIPAVDNPNASPGNLIGNALKILYIFGGLAVLFFMVWGAFDWITSGGEKEKVAAAQKKITNSLIGLALLALSAFIVALFGDIVGINPLDMGTIPTLGQKAP